MIKEFKNLLKVFSENKKLEKIKNLLEDYYSIDEQIKKDALKHQHSPLFGFKTAINLTKKKMVEDALKKMPKDVFTKLGITRKDCVDPWITCSCQKFKPHKPDCPNKKIRLSDSIYIGDNAFICFNCYYLRYKGTYISLGKHFEQANHKCSSCKKTVQKKYMLSDPDNRNKIYCASCFLNKFEKRLILWKKDLIEG